MSILIINSVKFLIFTFLILIHIDKLRCAVIFPIANRTVFRQNFRNFQNGNQILHFNRNLSTYTPKQFGVFTRQKFVDNTINSCSLKNCQHDNLTIQKNRELLKIRRENSAGSGKLPNHSNELPLQEIKTGNSNQLPVQLSTFIRNAADMLKLFERIGTQERNAQYSEVPVQQIIRRKSPMRDLSVLREFRSGRKSLPMKPLIEFSHDDTPTIASKGNLQSKTIAEDTAWAELLFGPRGVLTAVFHILDDRRKITEKIKGRTTIVKNVNDRSQTTDTYHQSDLSLLPDFLVDAKPIDFAKIFEAFLTGSKGNFDERISNLPEILGICNRLSCGDIYKAIDEFRKSEFFTNFQMILQLIQDPKGWEILGDFISNPDLIAQFMNGAGNKDNRGSIGNFLGGIIGPDKLSKNSNKEIGSEDGDIGIDFSKLVENQGSQFTKPKKPTAEEFPEIAENIDSIDYYNAVEMGTDIDGIETIVKPDEIAIAGTTPISSIQTEVLPVIPDLMLPEISENIDQIEQTRIIIDATIPTPAKISNRKSAATLRPLRPYFTATYQPVTAKTTVVRKQTITSSNRSTTRHPSWIVTTVTRSTPKTTTRNFREESDYYSMYYDDVSS